jgi:ribosome recycling factor
MASLLRHHTLRLSIAQTISRPSPLTSLLTTATTPRRAYASKKAKTKTKHSGADETESQQQPASKRAPIATTFLTPGSQRGLTNPSARDEFERADAKMASCVEWLRREVAQLEARASGRVTPQLLAPVRVSVPVVASESAAAASGAKKARLEELATVGVRDGSSLIVTVFDPPVSFCCVPFSSLLFSFFRVPL